MVTKAKERQKPKEGKPAKIVLAKFNFHGRLKRICNGLRLLVFSVAENLTSSSRWQSNLQNNWAYEIKVGTKKLKTFVSRCALYKVLYWVNSGKERKRANRLFPEAISSVLFRNRKYFKFPPDFSIENSCQEDIDRETWQQPKVLQKHYMYSIRWNSSLFLWKLKKMVLNIEYDQIGFNCDLESMLAVENL